MVSLGLPRWNSLTSGMPCMRCSLVERTLPKAVSNIVLSLVITYGVQNLDHRTISTEQGHMRL